MPTTQWFEGRLSATPCMWRLLHQIPTVESRVRTCSAVQDLNKAEHPRAVAHQLGQLTEEDIPADEPLPQIKALLDL